VQGIAGLVDGSGGESQTRERADTLICKNRFWACGLFILNNVFLGEEKSSYAIDNKKK
jgi:hypothetical protein